MKFEGEKLNCTPLVVSLGSPKYILNVALNGTCALEWMLNGMVPVPPGGSVNSGEIFGPSTNCEEVKPSEAFNSTLAKTGVKNGVANGC